MKHIYLCAAALALGLWQANAQTPVAVGSGSYASAVPAAEDIDWNEDGVGDIFPFINTQTIYVQPGETRPIPTNDWWTSLLVEQYSGLLWAYPLMVDAESYGPRIFFPNSFSADGSNIVYGGSMMIKATGYTPEKAIAKDWSDWGVVMGIPDAAHNKNIDVTMAHGIPFVWLQTQGVNPELSFDAGASYLTAAGTAVQFPTTSSFVVQTDGRYMGVHLPGNASAEIQNQQYVQIDLGSTQPITKVSLNWEAAFAKGYGIQVSTNGSTWTSVATETNGNGGIDDITLNTSGRYVRVVFNERGTIYAYSLWEVSIFNGATLLSLNKTATAASTEANYFATSLTDGNTGTRWASDASQFEKLVINTGNGGSYFVVSALHNPAELTTYETYAFNRVTNTQVLYDYTAATGKVATTWNITTANLKGQANGNTVQGFLPHLYYNAANTVNFNTPTYVSPRGTLKTANGKSFTFTYDFNGIIPSYNSPYSNSADAHPYDADVMFNLLTNFSKKQGYGGDTYWGGKDLVNYAKYMLMAKEVNHQAYESLKAKTKESLINWLTYTPGETEKFFARYDRWKAIVGFNESYGSSQFTDNHFHYGYLIQACAMYGMVDPQFLTDYGPMIKLVAQQYANWNRNDTFLPYLRTFDPWIGHSYAGGTSSSTGNNQESTSEAMQSWTGLFLLGDMLNDESIRDVGAFGYTTESFATLEYWFDWKNRNLPAAYPHDVVGILSNQGFAYGTYFSASPVHIHGIQYLPVNPGFKYLARDKQWAAGEYADMMTESAAIDGHQNELDFGDDWAHVALGFRQLYDPEYVAGFMEDNLALAPTSPDYIMDYEAAGMTYYYTHANQNLGDFSFNYRTNFPTSSTFEVNGTFSHAVAYNPTATAKTCTIYNSSNGVVGSFTVPAYTMVTYPSLPTTGQQPTGCYGLAPVAATATSGGNSIAAAIDGNLGSRWESAFADPQTLTVDLGVSSHVDAITLSWEAANAKDYTLSGSVDGNTWAPVATKTNMAAGARTDVITNVNANYRYLRMIGTARTIPYGYSIYEFEVCGSAASTPTTNFVTLPAQIQAESYTAQSGVQLETTSDTGAGQNVGYIDTNDYMDYQVYAPTAGSYPVQFRISSPYTGTSIQLLSNGNAVGTYTLTNTGGWQTWQTVNGTVTLPAGNQTLRVKANVGGFNLNWFNVGNVGSGLRFGNLGTGEKETDEVSGSFTSVTQIYPNPAHNLINVVTDKDADVAIYNVNGALIKQQAVKQGESQINIEGFASGVYFVRVGQETFKLAVE
ncbi:glycosyl hydrolase [Flavobacterium subsaxonicum]|uniref:glucan endo-1,3-beta-D-glucosidase n=1 Tax=Flavobacterium subsaxonicum WB 4.1-42 = DSM 21790 TaxID=1121898 RepID=A0A0A2MSM2_9FLAO|nr:glycosyl hydrolase [Flavobacterium subsaxonicum]KGO94601.1 hypothetical protein Q766_00300 [Flavobacterium subsaxonicum WB 4.1-42 = DSM 21790]